MKNFKSEPFQDFCAQHTRLNNYIKLTTASATYLFNSSSNSAELSKLISDQIQLCGQRWTPRTFEHPSNELTNLKNDLAMTGMIWVYSAFDEFFKRIEGHLSSLPQKAGQLEPELNSTNNEDAEQRDIDKVSRIYEKYNWPLENIKDILPIKKFFDLLRHRVAHSSGDIDNKTSELLQSAEFREAISAWKTKRPGYELSPPPIIDGDTIRLQGHHPIFYSEACLRIATDINDRYGQMAGINYLIENVIKNRLMARKVLPKPYGMDFGSFIVAQLREQYCIETTRTESIDKFFTDPVMLKDYHKKYTWLKKEATNSKLSKKK